MPRTSTTANALLGLLALRPSWSTYDLANELANNLHFFWPRAESRIYAETKNLHERGLADATVESIGPHRNRTRYTLTDHGRDELADWLATPPRRTVIECEPLLRVLLGELGNQDQLLEAVHQVQHDAEAMRAVGRTLGQQYLAGTAPFQGHIHVRALVFDFLVNLSTMLDDWSRQTATTVAAWEGQDETARMTQSRQLIAAGVARIQASS
jgi:DNA-binding PadR family transcriptional regulator